MMKKNVRKFLSWDSFNCMLIAAAFWLVLHGGKGDFLEFIPELALFILGALLGGWIKPQIKYNFELSYLRNLYPFLIRWLIFLVVLIVTVNLYHSISPIITGVAISMIYKVFTLSLDRVSSDPDS